MADSSSPSMLSPNKSDGVSENIAYLPTSISMRNVLVASTAIVLVLSSIIPVVLARIKLPIKIFLFNLLASDVTFMISTLLYGSYALQMGNQIKSDSMACHTVVYVIPFGLVLCHVFITAITANNFIAMFYPFKYNSWFTTRNSLVGVLIAWLSVAAFCVGCIGIQKQPGLPCSLFVVIRRSGLFAIGSVMFICDVSVFSMTIRLCLKLWNRGRGRIQPNPTTRHQNNLLKNTGTGARAINEMQELEVGHQSHRIVCEPSTSTSTNVFISDLDDDVRKIRPTSILQSSYLRLPHWNYMNCPPQYKHQQQGTYQQGGARGNSSKAGVGIIHTRNSVGAHELASNAVGDGTPYLLEYNRLEMPAMECPVIMTRKESHPSMKQTVNNQTVNENCDEHNAEQMKIFVDPGRNERLNQLQHPPRTTQPSRSATSLTPLNINGASTRPNYFITDQHVRQLPSAASMRFRKLSITMVIISLWCTILNVPFLIMIFYVSTVAENRVHVHFNSFGLFATTLICIDILGDPIIYAWRFIDWAFVSRRLRSLCQ